MLELVDRGDFLGVAGKVMRTRKGELSVQARELTFLSKALLPPPDKWHGVSDVEIRYRQRYVDLMMNPEVRKAFLAHNADLLDVDFWRQAQDRARSGYIEDFFPYPAALRFRALYGDGAAR